MGMFDNLQQKSEEELLNMIAGMTRDNPIGVAVERVLQVRIGQRQVEAGKALVRATRWLVAVTLLLAMTTATQVYLAYRGFK
jgi:hypothetical protein